MAFTAYVVFTVLLANLRSLLNELEDRVGNDQGVAMRNRRTRTTDREIATVADRERRRLGQELHDSLCQHPPYRPYCAKSRDKLAGRLALK
jgi:signal transduction histidine kinase